MSPSSEYQLGTLNTFRGPLPMRERSDGSFDACEREYSAVEPSGAFVFWALHVEYTSTERLGVAEL